MGWETALTSDQALRTLVFPMPEQSHCARRENHWGGKIYLRDQRQILNSDREISLK